MLTHHRVYGGVFDNVAVWRGLLNTGIDLRNEGEISLPSPPLIAVDEFPPGFCWQVALEQNRVCD